MHDAEKARPDGRERLLVRLRARRLEQPRPRVELHLAPAQHERRERVDRLLDRRVARGKLLPRPELLEQHLGARDELEQRRAHAEGLQPLADLQEELERRVLGPLREQLAHAHAHALDDGYEAVDLVGILCVEDVGRARAVAGARLGDASLQPLPRPARERELRAARLAVERGRQQLCHRRQQLGRQRVRLPQCGRCLHLGLGQPPLLAVTARDGARLRRGLAAAAATSAAAAATELAATAATRRARRVGRGGGLVGGGLGGGARAGRDDAAAEDAVVVRDEEEDERGVDA